MKPEIVIAVDPGGTGTTGIVELREWRYEPARWPPFLPVEIDVATRVGDSACPWSWEGAVTCVEILSDREGALERSALAIEDVTLYQGAGESLKTTAFQIGALEYMGRMHLLTDNVVRVPAQTVRSWLLGGKAPKGKADSLVDQALLAAYGGEAAAVGGKRCTVCGGKGFRGRGFRGRPGWWIGSGPPAMSRVKRGPDAKDGAQVHYIRCEDCGGEGESPRGPLHPLWKPSLPHCRAALAVGLYCYNEVWK